MTRAGVDLSHFRHLAVVPSIDVLHTCWVKLPRSEPPPRDCFCLAFDSVEKVIVTFVFKNVTLNRASLYLLLKKMSLQI